MTNETPYIQLNNRSCTHALQLARARKVRMRFIGYLSGVFEYDAQSFDSQIAHTVEIRRQGQFYYGRCECEAFKFNHREACRHIVVCLGHTMVSNVIEFQRKKVA